MAAVVKGIDATLRVLLILLVAMLVVSVAWQVLSRYLLQDPASWTEELARFLLIWVGMLGASYAFRTRTHLGLELLPMKLKGTGAGSMLKYFTLLMAAFFATAILVYGGGNLVALTWELRQYSPVLGLPIAVVYSVIPLSGVLIIFSCLVQAFEDDNEPLAATSEDEL